MSESTEGRRSGRPSGASAKTLSDGALFAALQKFGHSPEEIAARQGCNRSWVYEAIKAYTKAQAPGPNLHVVSEDDAQDDATPLPPPRKLGASTFARRALDAARKSDLMTHLHPYERWLWVDVVSTIHAYGDAGIELRFERPGLFHSAARLAERFGCDESDLDRLIDDGLLTRIDGGIAMPVCLDLRPKAKGARSRTRQAGAPDRAQPSILYPISGGLADAPEAGNPTTKESRADGVSEDSPAGLSEDSRADPHAAAAAKSREYQDLGSSSSKPAHASESSKTPDSVSSKTPDAESSKTPDADVAPETLGTMMAELATVGRRGGKFSGHEKEALRTWAAASIPVEFAKQAILAKLAERRRTEGVKWLPSSLAYFKDPVMEAWAEARPVPAATNGHAEPAPVVPEEPDEPAPEGDSPEARFQRMRRDLKREVGPVEFRTWLGAMTLVSVIDGEATMGQTTRFLSDWVRGHHGDRLLRLWQLQDPTIRRVKIVVSPAQPAAAPD